MRKEAALNLFNGSVADAARALGVSYQAIDKWPDPLPRRIMDRVVAACVYSGIAIPADLLTEVRQAACAAAQEVAHG